MLLSELQAITLTKADRDQFKAIKALFDQATYHLENQNPTLHKHFEDKAERNVAILVGTTGIEYGYQI